MKFARIAVIVIVFVSVILFSWYTAGTDTRQLVIGSLEAWEEHLHWIILVVSGLIVVSTLAGLPVLYLSIALGFFLPWLPAMAVAWTINLLAVMATFIMVRRLYYVYFRKKYGDKRIIRGINRRIGKYGLWTVAVTRAVYFIPTNIINFSFPLSRITLRKYMTGTMIGLVPESVINVGTGYLLRHEILLLEDPGNNFWQIVFIAAVLLLITALLIFLRYRKKRNARIRLGEVVPLLDEQ